MKHLIAAALAAPLLVACQAEDIATPQEKAQLAAYDAQLDAMEQNIDDLEEAYKGFLGGLEDLAENVEGLTAAQVQDAAAELVASAEATRLEYEGAVAAWEAKAQERDDLVGEVISGVTDPLIPFLPPGLPQALPLLVPFLFDRPRKHLGKSIEHTMKGSIADAAQSLLKIPGLLHSAPEEQPKPGDTVSKS